MRAMFRVCEMMALCIRSRISPPRAPNSSLIVLSTSVDHPPKTLMMMLYCRMSYPGNCCLSSQRRGPYTMLFSSCFFSLFFALLAHVLQRLVYPNMLGPRVTRRWVLGRQENTTVALCQRVEALLAFPRKVL